MQLTSNSVTADRRDIPGLGHSDEVYVPKPGVEASRLWLTPEESRLFGLVGRGVRLIDFLERSGLDEVRTCDLVRALRTKGAIVPLREVQTPATQSDALNEPDVDLDVARRQDILSMEKLLETLNYYELLGVPTSASAEQIKRASLERSAWYHPDKYFGRRLGSFKARMEKIFKRLRVAQAALLDEVQREAYDAQLGVKRAESPGVTVGRERERKARLARHPYLRAIARKAQDAAHGGVAEGGVISRDASGRKSNAFASLQSAADKAEELAQLEAEVSRACEFEALGAWGDAARAWQTASNMAPTELKYATKAVLVGLAAGIEGRALRFWAQRCVDLGGHKPEPHVLMARVLFAVGNQVLANKSLERALEIDPQHEEALQLLKKKKKGFWG